MVPPAPCSHGGVVTGGEGQGGRVVDWGEVTDPTPSFKGRWSGVGVFSRLSEVLKKSLCYFLKKLFYIETKENPFCKSNVIIYLNCIVQKRILY